MAVWFTADTHFGHKFMADLRGTGRDKLEEHDEMILEALSVMGRNDELWHLGDFSFWGRKQLREGVERNRKLFDAIKPRKKFLVRGNHDPRHVVDLGWSGVTDLAYRSFEGQRFVMCHYPLLTWQNAHHGSYHLHGHSHGNLQAPVSTRMDVGADCSDGYRPFSLEEVMEILNAREYDFVDHHDRGTAYREGKPQDV